MHVGISREKLNILKSLMLILVMAASLIFSAADFSSSVEEERCPDASPPFAKYLILENPLPEETIHATADRVAAAISWQLNCYHYTNEQFRLAKIKLLEWLGACTREINHTPTFGGELLRIFYTSIDRLTYTPSLDRLSVAFHLLSKEGTVNKRPALQQMLEILRPLSEQAERAIPAHAPISEGLQPPSERVVRLVASKISSIIYSPFESIFFTNERFTRAKVELLKLLGSLKPQENLENDLLQMLCTSVSNLLYDPLTKEEIDLRDNAWRQMYL